MVDSGPLATRQSVRHPFLTQLGRLLLHISNTKVIKRHQKMSGIITGKTLHVGRKIGVIIPQLAGAPNSETMILEYCEYHVEDTWQQKVAVASC